MVSYDTAALTSPTHLFADHQGSIVALVNSSGAVSAINRYDEYGIPQGPAGAGTLAGRFGYTGQLWLSEIGMWHYKARVYSPYLGRFLQTDPIGYEGGMNPYAYAGNDPVNHVDPTGLKTDEYHACGSRIRGANRCSGISGLDFNAFMAEQNQRQGPAGAGSSANAAQARAGRTKLERLRTCITNNPDDMCGMVRNLSPSSVATLRGLLANPTARNAMVNAITYALMTRREQGVWFNAQYQVLAVRNGGVGWAPFSPVPDGGAIYFHAHVLLMSNGNFPGLSRDDLGWAAHYSVMTIILNTEQQKYWWQDYRQ